MRYLRLLRIHNYLKNLFVFMPAFFSGQLFDTDNLWLTSIAFISFSLLSSAVYVMNDLRDLESDRAHPEKMKRSIASGVVSERKALTIGIALLFASLSIAYLTSFELLWILLAYLAINIAYSFGLKNIAIVDITIVSLCFILRIEAGHAVTGIAISKWLMIMVFLLSMFQALAKRLDDLHLLANKGQLSRKSVHGYSIEFLQIALAIFSAVLLVCYIIYITSPMIEARLGSYAYVTFLPVLLGILRYLQICFVKKEVFDPVRILIRDPFIKILILLWVATFAYFLYV